MASLAEVSGGTSYLSTFVGSANNVGLEYHAPAAEKGAGNVWAVRCANNKSTGCAWDSVAARAVPGAIPSVVGPVAVCASSHLYGCIVLWGEKVVGCVILYFRSCGSGVVRGHVFLGGCPCRKSYAQLTAGVVCGMVKAH